MATAIGGIMRVERMKKSRSSASGTLKRENAYAASVPRNTARKVEPKPITSELTKRGSTFDGPAITMLRERTSRSYQVSGAGRLARNSGVCRVRVVKRFTYPSIEGWNHTLGG